MKTFKVVDHGCFDSKRVDYPDYAQKIGQAVSQDSNSLGFLVDGTGIGIGIAANKIKVEH
jgi:ribose 5-phosphate isomerase B